MLGLKLITLKLLAAKTSELLSLVFSIDSMGGLLALRWLFEWSVLLLLIEIQPVLVWKLLSVIVR